MFRIGRYLNSYGVVNAPLERLIVYRLKDGKRSGLEHNILHRHRGLEAWFLTLSLSQKV